MSEPISDKVQAPPRRHAFAQLVPWAAYCDPPLLERVKEHVLDGLRAYVDREQLDVDWDTLTGPDEHGRTWLIDTGDPDPEHPGQTLVLHLPWPPEEDPDRPPTLVRLGATVRERRPEG